MTCRRTVPWARACSPAVALLLVAACGVPSEPPPTLDWLLGDWHGTRRDGSDGSEALLTVHIELLADGPGVVERLQVSGQDGPYVGFAVRVPSETSGRWHMLYANPTRETFGRLEGEVVTGRATWQSVSPGRAREARVMERARSDRYRDPRGDDRRRRASRPARVRARLHDVHRPDATAARCHPAR